MGLRPLRAVGDLAIFSQSSPFVSFRVDIALLARSKYVLKGSKNAARWYSGDEEDCDGYKR